MIRGVQYRRSDFELYLDILDVVGHGTKKVTHIQYQVNTNWIKLIRCLKHLMARGLIKQEQKRYYVLTEEGYIALKHGVDFKWAVLP